MDGRNNQRPILELLSAGNYDKTIKLVVAKYRGTSTKAILSRAFVFIEAGKYAEAEQIYRKLLASDKLNDSGVSIGTKMQTLLGLGSSLMWQDHPKEAMAVFQRARTLLPDAPGPYNEAAAIYLRTNQHPDYALRLTDKALTRVPQNQKLGPHVYRNHILANRAWALALLGESAKANTMVEELVRIPALDVPVAAKFNYYAGQVAAIGNDMQQAQIYFNKVLLSDPNGRYAPLARKSLEQMPTQN